MMPFPTRSERRMRHSYSSSNTLRVASWRYGPELHNCQLQERPWQPAMTDTIGCLGWQALEGQFRLKRRRIFSGNVGEESTSLRDEMEISLVLLTASYIQLRDWVVLYNWGWYFRLYRRMWGRRCYYSTRVPEEFFIDICLCLQER